MDLERKKKIYNTIILKRTFEGKNDPEKNNSSITSKYCPSKKFVLVYDKEDNYYNPITFITATKKEAAYELESLKNRYEYSATEWVKNPTTETYDYHYEELMKARKEYNVQNHLMRSINFPKYYFTDKNSHYVGDYIGSTYIDRINDAMREKIKHIKGELYKMSDRQLLELGNILSDKKNITGVRVVEYTNAMNGYPLYRIDMYAKHHLTPETEMYKNSNGNIEITERGYY